MTRPPAFLPAPLYGRERDLDCLQKVLRGGGRLVTLRGPGGIGKTALARHLSWTLDSAYDYVGFIDLSALSDPSQVLAWVAASLPSPERLNDPARVIQTFTSHQRSLLVLDNFEQVLPAGEALSDLLAVAPLLTLVVTSRTALHLHAEHEYPVGPLALPERVSVVASSPAVQLFVHRVQAAVPDFEVNPYTSGQVMRLCEALEGIPLALELAAARMRTYSLTDLLDRLSSPLTVLKADFRDRPERLRSLRAAMQWSYDLLGADDQALFECCAVFEGGLTPAALVAVWGSDDILDRIDALIEQSFLQRVPGVSTRWKMLQPLRELALERLPHHPDAPSWRQRHASHYLERLEEGYHQWLDTRTDRRGSFLPDYPNIRAGLMWASQNGQADLAYRYLFQVQMLWVAFGLHAQETALAQAVMALPAPSVPQRLQGLQILAECLRQGGRRHEYHARLDELMAVCAEVDDLEGVAWARLSRADLDVEEGRSARALEIRQAVVQDCAARWGGHPVTQLQQVLWANALWAVAHSLLDLGRPAEALDRANDARQRFEAAGNAVFELEAMLVAARALLELHRAPEAHALLLGCLERANQQDFQGVVRDILRQGLMPLAAAQGDLTAVVAFAAYRVEADRVSKSVLDSRVQDLLSTTRGALGDAAFQEAWTSGKAMLLPDVAALAARLGHKWGSAPASQPALVGLTLREQEVLALVAQGLPDRKVAQRLGISPGTASKHVGNLLGKLGLRNRVELTRWALEHADPAG